MSICRLYNWHPSSQNYYFKQHMSVCITVLLVSLCKNKGNVKLNTRDTKNNSKGAAAAEANVTKQSTTGKARTQTTGALLWVILSADKTITVQKTGFKNIL